MIRIGVLLQIDEDYEAKIKAYASAGFEAVSLTLWERSPVPALEDLLERACDLIRRQGLTVSSFSIYGNPLLPDTKGVSIREIWQTLVIAAARCDVPVVSGFAGRVPGTAVEDSIGPWRDFFAPLADSALGTGTCLAFENCRLGDTWKTGKWNIAINPDAWSLMFAALDAPNIGLEWEPCHQLETLADPVGQLDTWVSRVVHVHGKDSKIDRAALAHNGFYAKKKWHSSVLPGVGDSDWAAIFGLLTRAGYTGTVDVENPLSTGEGFETAFNDESKSLSYLKLSRLP
jgi:sugar phosphate isomerase/epimerase